MPDAFEQKILGLPGKNTTLVLGISGGPDSVYLLQRCLEINKNHPLKIVIAHVNHGLRGKAGDLDEKFVEALAKRNGLLFKSIRCNLKKRTGNLEEQGRNARYDFFEKIRRQYGAHWILTAHHLNDSIETSLFNLIRGSSFAGMKGMQTISPKRHLLRPMLHLTKAEILQFLKQRRFTFHQDKSNKDLHFSRNLLREKIIPLVQKINPGFEQTFSQNLENFREIADFMDTKSQEWLKKYSSKNGHDLEQFLKEAPALQKNILVRLYKKAYGTSQKITYRQIGEMLKVLRLKKAGLKKEFGEMYFMAVRRAPKNNKYFFRPELKPPNRKVLKNG